MRRTIVNEQIEALREQREFEARQLALRDERILRVAADNPDLTNDELGERFGIDSGIIRRLVGPRPDYRIGDLRFLEQLRRLLPRAAFNLWPRRAVGK